MTSDGVLPFEQFAVYLAEGVELEPEALSEGARLDEDLGLDSFDMLEVLVRIEELGVHVPEEIVAGLKTVGDLHHSYAALLGSAADRESASSIAPADSSTGESLSRQPTD